VKAANVNSLNGGDTVSIGNTFEGWTLDNALTIITQDQVTGDLTDMSDIAAFLSAPNNNPTDFKVIFTTTQAIVYFIVSDGTDAGLYQANAAIGASTDNVIDADELTHLITLTGISDASTLTQTNVDLIIV